MCKNDFFRVSIPLPDTETPDGPRVVIVRTSIYDADKFHIIDIFQMAMMMNEILMLEDDNFVIAGLLNIVDMVGVKASQFSQFTPRIVEKIMFVTQEALPVRQRGFHFLNLPVGGYTALNMIKSIFNAKNKARAEESMIVRIFWPFLLDIWF